VIDYQYDALYRLTEANYSDGRFFHYAYDSNGNRVSETTGVGTVESVYDSANRLTSVGATGYTWDANGNLTNDGGRTYVYNAANRLTGVTQNGQTVNYSYNGLGDRLVEGTTQFEMDLNTGLTQALSDGTNTYLYGNERIGQFAGQEYAYFLSDGLGSARQLTNGDGTLDLVRSYTPYGEISASVGSIETNYSFTGEWNSNNLIYLRARFLTTSIGRFINSDPSKLERNLFLYANSNPINRTDPLGLFSPKTIADNFGLSDFDELLKAFDNNINPFVADRWGLLSLLLDAKAGDNFTSIYPNLITLYPSWSIWDEGIIGYNNGTITISGHSIMNELRMMNYYYPYATGVSSQYPLSKFEYRTL